MIDEEYSSGSIFSKIILTKFDKINFQKFLAPDNDAKTNRRWGRSIILEEIGLQYFSHTQGCLIKSFVSLRFIEFLEFTQGPLQGRSPPPSLRTPALPPPISCHRPQAKLAPRSAMRGTYFDRPLSNVRDHIFIGGMPLLSAPTQAP